MLDILLFGIFAVACIGAMFAVLAYLTMRRNASETINPLEMAQLLRREGDAIRAEDDANSRELRQEINQLLTHNQTGTMNAVGTLTDSLLRQVDAFGARLEQANQTTEKRINDIGERLNQDIEKMGVSANSNREALRTVIEQKLDSSALAHANAARELKEELSATFQRMREGVSDTLNQTSDHQKERLEAARQAIDLLTQKHGDASEQLRQTVQEKLDQLRNDNAAELEKVRATVDEKLQTTLEARLAENFGRVIEQLNKAYEVFGEMRNISASVGDLKNVLTNPKLRGTFGEVQLEMLLQDFLSPTQYIKDAPIKGGRVDFAIRLPTLEGDDILLPVDAKFPREDHEHMIAAQEIGDLLLAEKFRKQLEAKIKSFAKDICSKYINPPETTERAILFLPTESLFAEVLRQPGLFDHLLRECNVMLAGPTTFAAILHSFQVNYRSMAIARQSGEVWKTLSAVRTEFQRYHKTIGVVARQLKTAAGSVDELGKRTDAMDRALKGVETMPDNGSAAKLLGLGEPASPDDSLAPEIAPTSEIVVSEDAMRAAE